MSGSTAIARTKPSVPAQWLVDNVYLPQNRYVLDYGCGRGVDAVAFGWVGYDPVHRPIELRNRQPFPFAYCGYVLNVVSAEAQVEILSRLLSLAYISYVAVRRDIPRKGKPGRGCYQRWVDLDPVPLIRETRDYAIYEVTNEGL